MSWILGDEHHCCPPVQILGDEHHCCPPVQILGTCPPFTRDLRLWLTYIACNAMPTMKISTKCMWFFELRTLRTQDTSDPGHFGTSLVGPNCPDRSALVPKCPKDSSDLSAELSCPKCRSVLARVWRLRCNRPEGQINRDSTWGITLKGRATLV